MKTLWNKVTAWTKDRSQCEQHIAVCGESGSGKTMLLSCFYGHHQAAAFRKSAGYGLLAKESGQGNSLLQQYHRITDDLLPPQTRFRQQSFVFSIRPHGLKKEAGKLVWHDYPGEWWSETKDGEEGLRKKEAFDALLSSDTALFLVDGQRLIDNDEHYIPRLFKTFRDEISRHGELNDGKGKLSRYPRIWTICLTKADLFPNKDVEWFRDEVIKQAGDEITALHQEISSLVERPECVSFGEDYLLLSSAKFNSSTGKVEDPGQTIGVDLIAPLAITTPLVYARNWAKIEVSGKATAGGIVSALRGLTTNWMKWMPIVGRFFQLLDDVLKGGESKLKEIRNRAIEKGDAVGAVFASLVARLRGTSTEKVYFRSVK